MNRNLYYKKVRRAYNRDAMVCTLVCFLLALLVITLSPGKIALAGAALLLLADAGFVFVLHMAKCIHLAWDEQRACIQL